MTQKICGICGEDCAGRPRVKDAKGRYYCRTCAEARRSRAGHGVPAPVSPEADHYAIDDESPLGGLLEGANAPTRCPVCAQSMGAGAKICVGCGYNAEQGIQTSTLIEKSDGRDGRRHRCEECGYELTGLREPVCPECGARQSTSLGARRAKWDKESEGEVIRNEWMKPAIVIAVGFVAVLAVLGSQNRADGIPQYGVFLLAEIALGYAVLWVSFSFLGDIGTPLLNLVRLTALYLVVDSIWMLFSMVPSFWLRTGVPAVVYIGLFMNFFDVHWEDAWIVMVINWFAKMALIMFAVLYANGQI